MLTGEMMLEGRIIRLKKYRDKRENFIGRVTSVRDTHDDPVQRESHRDRLIKRSRYLITLERIGETPEGEKKIRSIYHAFAEGEVCNES